MLPEAGSYEAGSEKIRTGGDLEKARQDREERDARERERLLKEEQLNRQDRHSSSLRSFDASGYAAQAPGQAGANIVNAVQQLEANVVAALTGAARNIASISQKHAVLDSNFRTRS